jgi:purine-binding chemotaxis protein CheW
MLAGEEYGIGILKVKEINRMMAITMIPQTPGYVKGVINLRGKVIPVVDLRLKVRNGRPGLSGKNLHHRGGNREKFGSHIDRHRRRFSLEVLNIKWGDIEETPNFGSRLDTDYILGMPMSLWKKRRMSCNVLTYPLKI